LARPRAKDGMDELAGRVELLTIDEISSGYASMEFRN
jgi:hypothetical protein